MQSGTGEPADPDILDRLVGLTSRVQARAEELRRLLAKVRAARAPPSTNSAYSLVPPLSVYVNLSPRGSLWPWPLTRFARLRWRDSSSRTCHVTSAARRRHPRRGGDLERPELVGFPRLSSSLHQALIKPSSSPNLSDSHGSHQAGRVQ